jgi:hypothetical protein
LKFSPPSRDPDYSTGYDLYWFKEMCRVSSTWGYIKLNWDEERQKLYVGPFRSREKTELVDTIQQAYRKYLADTMIG